LSKISQYFSTLEITRGFLVAFFSSLYLYSEYLGMAHPLISTFGGVLSIYLLMQSNTKTWFLSGFFIGLFWFWWIALSFKHYHMSWAIPIVVLFVGVGYGLIFSFIAYTANKLQSLFTLHSSLFTLMVKAFGLLTFSYVHPFGFDWFKPELMFVNSYLGIEKWQFALILLAITLSIWKKQFAFMLLILFAYHHTEKTTAGLSQTLQLVTTHTSVEEKWNKTLHKQQFEKVFSLIDKAIAEKKTLIVFPESVFPVFLNYNKKLIQKLKQKAKKISIVVGALYWDGKTPYNSAYIFTKGKVTIANKVLLVPFGESNPLPDFLSDWVNQVFYDGAVDYKADTHVIDYSIDGIPYRNAICFEATSEALYTKNKEGKRPENMMVLSNNGWFTPSIEPTLQRLLLQYYSKKYRTTIYHSTNMSSSYIIKDGTFATQ